MIRNKPGGLLSQDSRKSAPPRRFLPSRTARSPPGRFFRIPGAFFRFPARFLASGRPRKKDGRFFGFPGAHLSSGSAILLPGPSSSEPGSPDFHPGRHLRSRRLIFVREALSWRLRALSWFGGRRERIFRGVLRSRCRSRGGTPPPVLYTTIRGQRTLSAGSPAPGRHPPGRDPESGRLHPVAGAEDGSGQLRLSEGPLRQDHDDAGSSPTDR